MEKKPNISINSFQKYDGIVCHEDYISEFKSFSENKKCFKILATPLKKNTEKNFDFILKLPASVEEINTMIESSAAKSLFRVSRWGYAPRCLTDIQAKKSQLIQLSGYSAFSGQ